MINIFNPIKKMTSTNKSIINAVNKFCRTNLPNYINKNCHQELYKEFGTLGILGSTLSTSGCLGINYQTYGLIAKELEYIDSSFRSMVGVQTSLVMSPISKYGNDIAKDKYINDLRLGNKIGCFGLTESESGSDASKMKTYAVLKNDMYILNGSKTWITNAPIADIFIIWAKLNNRINGFIIEKDTLGLDITEIKNKLSFKSSPTGMIFLNNVKVPIENKLNVVGMKGPLSVLNEARIGLSMGALGAAESCIDISMDYVKNREMFGSYLSEKQLVQNKLVNMIIEYNLGLSLSMDIIESYDNGTCDPELISVIKRNNAYKSLEIARTARDILGANGITEEYNVFRHLNNLETVNTYEGTYDLHTLILGKYFIGSSAF